MTDVKALLSKAVQVGAAPGFSAAWITSDGAANTAAAGTLAQGNSTPVGDGSLFWIASCTKAVTALAALQLVEQGILTLDAPVAAHLPGLAAPLVLTGFDQAGNPVTRPAKTPITLRHLLCHTSGLGYDFCQPDLARNRSAPNPANGALLVFEPGEGWTYSVGLDWTGQLIEAASGQPFHQYLEDHVFAPLGMADTTFFPSDEQALRQAGMHMRLPDGGVAPIPFALPSEPSPMMGGGGLYSTAADYLRFLRAVLSGGAIGDARILSAASTQTLCHPLISGEHVGVLRTSNPMMSSDFDPFPGMSKSWSLGFVHNDAPGPAGRSRGSMAWAGLSNCYYWADPTTNTAGVLLAQVLPFGDARIMQVFADFERAVYEHT